MLQNLLYVLLLLAGFPAGIALAKLCKDELKKWKNRFIIIAGISLLLALSISFSNFEFKLAIIMTSFFMVITSITIVWKSH